MYQDRKAFYSQLARKRRSKLLIYITGDRPGLETHVSSEVYNFFVNHLDKIGIVPKISLYLYTRGGDPLTAWSLVNLIRQFCDKLEVIIPSKAQSAGTLIALGADSILMTKQATLSPIDPSISTPLNPQIPNAPHARMPVSVEAIQGFADFAREELKITDGQQLALILAKLVEYIHPLVLGQVYRTRAQTQMLARRLVSAQITEPEKLEKLINFLCVDSGSHDYTIHRREARDTLGLKVEKPNDLLYSLIKGIYDDLESDLQLNSALNPNALLGTNAAVDYSFRRSLVESIEGGSDCFTSEGIYRRQGVPQLPQGVILPPNIQLPIEDSRSFEGWRHENA